MSKRFSRELKELSRSRPYSNLSSESQDVTRILIQSGEEEKHRLDAAIVRVVGTATIIPLTRETITAAIRLQAERSLSPQDSMVYASVLFHLATAPDGPKCFLMKNSKDFANPDIYTDLDAYGCKLLTSFNHGLGYVRSQLQD